MEEHIDATQLIEYIEQAADGSYCKLMGWPSQIGLSTQSSKFNSANLESWYPSTAPTFPSALKWMPYKIVKTVPHVIQLDQGHPLHGALRYHKDVGWHYRYSMPFRVTGRPSLPSSLISKTSHSSMTSTPKVKRRSKKPRLKTKGTSFQLKKIALSIGLPDLRLRRIDQQAGFGSLLRLLTNR